GTDVRPRIPIPTPFPHARPVNVNSPICEQAPPPWPWLPSGGPSSTDRYVMWARVIIRTLLTKYEEGSSDRRAIALQLEHFAQQIEASSSQAAFELRKVAACIVQGLGPLPGTVPLPPPAGIPAGNFEQHRKGLPVHVATGALPSLNL